MQLGPADLLVMVLYGYVAALMLTATLAFPLVAILTASKRIDFKSVLCAGVAVGVVGGLAVVGESMVAGAIIGGVGGWLGALVYWPFVKGMSSRRH